MLPLPGAISVVAAIGGGGGAPATFTDDFNRANENLEASENWTRVGGSEGDVTIASNVLSFNTTNSTGTAFLCPDQGSADHYTQVERRTDVTRAYFDCCVRLTDASNFIGFRRESSQWQMYRRVAGAFTQIGTASSPAAQVGDVMRLQAVGDQISAYVNDSLVIGPITETAHQSVTRQGFVARSVTQNPAIDNFEAGVVP